MDNRRGFLKGLLSGVTATGLIIAAKPEEIAAFTKPLAKDAEIVIDTPTPRAASIGQHLYNEHGELVAVVTDLSIHTPMVDATSWGDSEQQMMVSGLPEATITARMIGHAVIDDHAYVPRLRGRYR
jgi:hypothetical protein